MGLSFYRENLLSGKAKMELGYCLASARLFWTPGFLMQHPSNGN